MIRNERSWCWKLELICVFAWVPFGYINLEKLPALMTSRLRDSWVTIFSIIVSVLFPAKIAFYPTFNSNSQWIWMSCIRHLDIPTTIITISLPGVHVLLLLLPITGLHNSISPLPDYNNCVRFISVVHQGFIISLEVFLYETFLEFQFLCDMFVIRFDPFCYLFYTKQRYSTSRKSRWLVHTIHTLSNPGRS